MDERDRFNADCLEEANDSSKQLGKGYFKYLENLGYKKGNKIFVCRDLTPPQVIICRDDECYYRVLKSQTEGLIDSFGKITYVTINELIEMKYALDILQQKLEK